MEGFRIVAGGFTPRSARMNQYQIYLKEGNIISNYHKLYYHVTWAVKNRLPLIVPTLKEPLYSYLSSKTMDFGGIAFAVGGVANHIHLVLSIPPNIAVAAFIGKLKGASSHWINHLERPEESFGWQDGYGVFSLHKDILDQVKAYVENQNQHHNEGTIIEVWEV